MDPIDELLSRRVQAILPTKAALEKKLRSGDRIRLYQGFDPSSPNLHIGHLVGLLQLKMFQELGHEVIFLIGDFTGMIGDPTDKSATRPKLTREQVLINAKTYREQAGRILNFEGDNPVKILFNSKWSDTMTFADLIEISSNLTVQQMIERDMFQVRLSKKQPIYLHEFLYPVAQGYDSVAMDVDLEIGGNDQLFNMMVGRHLMKTLKNKEKFVLTTKLLTDNEGKKIGKTTGNAINLFGDAADLYGAIMSQPDSIVIPGFELATTVPQAEIDTVKSRLETEPMQMKKQLAFEIVKICQGEEQALAAQMHFESTFQQKDNSQVITTHIYKSAGSLLEILDELHLGASNSDRKRIIRDGGLELNGEKLFEPSQSIDLKTGDIIKYGKHTIIKIDITS